MDNAVVNGLPNGDGISNGVAVDGIDGPGSLSATTISTVAVQAGKTKIVLAILKVSQTGENTTSHCAARRSDCC